MLELGVDEFTVVCRPTALHSNFVRDNWPHVAQNIIQKLSDRGDLETVLGPIRPELKCLKGYTHGYTFGEHSFYSCVAYHMDRDDMGVALRFSAQALDYYSDKSGLKVYEFLGKIQDTAYTARFSRIDFTADYLNCGIDPTKIYQKLMDGKLAIFREKTRKTASGKTETSYLKIPFSYRGFLKASEVPTIYLGSQKSNALLRIYDKRREQIERKGPKLDKALACEDWTRFEAVFKGDYAHQLTDQLLSVKSEDEYLTLIANSFLQKFDFREVENGVVQNEAEFSEMLYDALKQGDFALHAPTSRNFDLIRSIQYLLNGSGLYPTLFKIREIWGYEGVSEFVNRLIMSLDTYEPNRDCLSWIAKHGDDYKRNFSEFSLFLNSALPFSDFVPENTA